MRRIQELLKQYTKLSPPDESVRRAAQGILKDVCNIHVSHKDISYRNRSILLDVSPTARSTVLVHKSVILKKLHQHF